MEDCVDVGCVYVCGEVVFGVVGCFDCFVECVECVDGWDWCEVFFVDYVYVGCGICDYGWFVKLVVECVWLVVCDDVCVVCLCIFDLCYGCVECGLVY